MLLKRLPAALLLLCFHTNLHAQTQDIVKKVDKLIGEMTLDEKIGQMTQVTLGVVAKGGGGNEDGSLDPEALRHAVLDYKVGSILNTTAHALLRNGGSCTNRNQDEKIRPGSGDLWSRRNARPDLYLALPVPAGIAAQPAP
jgi:hypothetical protein